MQLASSSSLGASPHAQTLAQAQARSAQPSTNTKVSFLVMNRDIKESHLVIQILRAQMLPRIVLNLNQYTSFIFKEKLVLNIRYFLLEILMLK